MARDSGRDGSALAGGSWASSGLEVLRTTDFPDGRLERSGTWVVCFGAEWCPVTRRFVPKFVERQRAWPATLAIADITDRNDPLWDTFRIRITPSVLVFRDAATILRIDGRRFLGVTSSDFKKIDLVLGATAAH